MYKPPTSSSSQTGALRPTRWTRSRAFPLKVCARCWWQQCNPQDSAAARARGILFTPRACLLGVQGAHGPLPRAAQPSKWLKKVIGCHFWFSIAPPFCHSEALGALWRRLALVEGCKKCPFAPGEHIAAHVPLPQTLKWLPTPKWSLGTTNLPFFQWHNELCFYPFKNWTSSCL